MSIGLPYMGSKRKLARRIVETILARHPGTRYVYDLFGGGGAISFEFLTHPGIHVVYNDVNTGIVELLKKLRDDGVTDSMYQWVDRDMFHKHKADPTWFGGLCQVVWSFGNDQRSYLYGKNIEEYKHAYHDIVVNNLDRTDVLSSLVGAPITMPTAEGYRERRLELTRQIAKHTRRKQYIFLQHLERLEPLKRLESLERLQHLESLQHHPLTICNKSYEEVVIDTPVNETIVYIDPPYKGVKKYQHGIDHDKLWDYVRNSPYPVYISSYEAPFSLVSEYDHLTGMNSGTKRRTERLLCSIP